MYSDYILLHNRSYSELAKEVNTYLANGYICIGGVCYENVLNEMVQAVVKICNRWPEYSPAIQYPTVDLKDWTCVVNNEVWTNSVSNEKKN